MTAQDYDHTHRTGFIDNARDLINGERAKEYGEPIVNFTRIAQLWRPIVAGDPGIERASTVALMLQQLKVARLITSPEHIDSHVDSVGYAAIAGELSQIESVRSTTEV